MREPPHPRQRDALSVGDHRFGVSALYSLGAEEELMLIDPRTWDLSPAIDTLLEAAAASPDAERLQCELLQPVIETTTTICEGVSDLAQQLGALRSRVGALAAEAGCAYASAGAHPFALFERQPVTERDRYRAMVEEYQIVARQQLIFGLHLHVGIDDPDRAIEVVEGFVAHLPAFLALSASSPLWRGAPTGLASYRQVVFSALPRTGLPPAFASYDAYAQTIGALERAGTIADYTNTWWDVRPHPRLGTVELRICDAVTRLDDAIALAAYFQSLAKALAERSAPERTAPLDRMVAAENKWLAARHGLEASLIDPARPERGRLGVRELVTRTLVQLRPHARELRCERELEGIGEILARGNGAQAQLRLWRGHDAAREVSRHLVAASAAELPAGSLGVRGGR